LQYNQNFKFAKIRPSIYNIKMAHKKGQGSSRNGRDSAGKRLGIKKFSGQLVSGGTILVRQRGTKVIAGKNVGRGKDDTLFARIKGIVSFKEKNGKKMVEVQSIS